MYVIAIIHPTPPHDAMATIPLMPIYKYTSFFNVGSDSRLYTRLPK